MILTGTVCLPTNFFFFGNAVLSITQGCLSLDDTKAAAPNNL